MVIAIIGILATLAVVALQQARQNARDSKRVADMKQVQTALELVFNENGRYPTTEEWNSGSITSSTTGEVFMYNIPIAPTPADGDCLEASNTYAYIPSINGDTYTIDFCTGKQVSDLPEGAKQMTPGGVVFGGSESGGGTPAWSCGDDFTDTRDGNIYPTVQIVDQCWFAKNLAYLPVVHNNTEFASQGASSQPGYGVYDYNGSVVADAKLEPNYSAYGVIYNWYAVSQVSTCPTGWHIPTHDEFTTLERSVCENNCEALFPYDIITTGYRGFNEGSKLAGEYNLWDDGLLRNNANFGESGFSVLPAGRRYANGSFVANFNPYFWSSSVYEPSNAWLRYFYSGTTAVGRSYEHQSSGFSVRCLKN